jgi:hypothetical protein
MPPGPWLSAGPARWTGAAAAGSLRAVSSLRNPYADCRGPWISGNLHGHSREHSSCASVPLLEGLARYHEAGARFCAVTDHDHVSDLAAARARWPSITLLEGFEWSQSENILFIGPSVPPLYELSLNEALRRADGLLTIICHPRPSLTSEYWTVPMIMALRPRPLGIEVYNAHYAQPHMHFGKPNPLYTEHWDALLSAGVRLWGFTNDDSHNPTDYLHTQTMVCESDHSPKRLMAALRAGRFYGSTGLRLASVNVRGGGITVTLASEARGRFIGPGGTVLAEGEGEEFHFRWDGEAYVRFEAEGGKGRIFLQPFFSG